MCELFLDCGLHGYTAEYNQESDAEILFTRQSITAWKRSLFPASSFMPVQYDSPWQRSTYPPDNEYRPPPQPAAFSHQEYSGYPPRTNFTNEQSQPLNDPNILSSMPPHETIDGATLRGRTPSPTPSELRGMKSGVIDWKTLSNWRFWIRKDWICTSSSTGIAFTCS